MRPKMSMNSLWNQRRNPAKIEVFIGGILVEILVDSGAITNVIDKHLWSKLKREKIECVSKKSNKKLYPYGSKPPLEVLGTFSALTKVGETIVKAEFVVIDGEGESQLGGETAVQLGCYSLVSQCIHWSRNKRSYKTTRESSKVWENWQASK